MHQKSFCIWIVDRWIVTESWGQQRFTPLMSPVALQCFHVFVFSGVITVMLRFIYHLMRKCHNIWSRRQAQRIVLTTFHFLMNRENLCTREVTCTRTTECLGFLVNGCFLQKSPNKNDRQNKLIFPNVQFFPNTTDKQAMQLDGLFSVCGIITVRTCIFTSLTHIVLAWKGAFGSLF